MDIFLICFVRLCMGGGFFIFKVMFFVIFSVLNSEKCWNIIVMFVVCVICGLVGVKFVLCQVMVLLFGFIKL